MKNISILGGGWLGFPLGKQLAKKHQVKISTTSENKLTLFSEAGLKPFLLEVPSHEQITTNNFFSNCDILIITIPPNRKKSEAMEYVSKINWIISQAENHQIKQVIYTSSTSVYDGLENEVDETTILKEDNLRANEIIINEENLLENVNFKTTILRLGGLFGEERHPVKFLAKKEVNENGNEPVNMLHLYDAIEAISTVIEKPIENEIYNLVYPQYDTREIFYNKAAKELNLSLASFKTVEFPKNRKVSSEKFQNKHKFTFKHF